LTEEIGVPCRVAADPLRAAALGAMVCVEEFNDWRNCLDGGDRG
jgi:hypothetical protein